MYNIYCKQRELWWGPNECGYLPERLGACVVTKEQVDADPMRYSNGIDTIAVPISGKLSEAYVPEPTPHTNDNPDAQTIYCFCNGSNAMGFMAAAICEDGHVLAQHACSSISFMKHDLGITSDLKHENYDNHCGQGNWRLEWVDEPDIANHKGLRNAFTLHKNLGSGTSSLVPPG